MMRRSLGASLAATIALCLAGCAAAPRVTDTVAEATLRDHPERLIVVTIANPKSTVSVRAGSTLRGYDGSGDYWASSLAITTVSSLSKDYSLRQVAAWPIDVLQVHCVVFRIPDGSERTALLTRLTRDSRVKIAQPLQVFATSSVAYNDPYVDLQRGFKALDIASAHQTSLGEGVRVAIIDTGVDGKHPDLNGRIVERKNFVDRDERTFALDRHGTGVAGVIAATGNNAQGIVGIAPGVKLLAIKACWQLQPNKDDARCNSFTLAQGLTAAMEAHAQIVNLSVSGPADPLLDELLKQGVQHGLIFVGAAPRDGKQASFPVSTPGVIAVDAAESRSGFRNAVPAPGADILTLTPDGHYDYASGASLATAHVTGTIALLLQQNRKLTTDALSTLLQQSHGAEANASINACAALATLNNHTSCQRQLREATSAALAQ